MKHSRFIAIAVAIFFYNNESKAQAFVTGQINNSFYYSPVDSNDISRLFTGVSAEIGVDALIYGFALKTALYIPKNFNFTSVIEDDYGFPTFLEVDQRITIFELGLYGKYFWFTEPGDPFRVATTTGLEFMLAKAKNNYTLLGDIVESNFSNKQLKYLIGLDLEIYIAEDTYLVTDILFKYPLSDMDINGELAVNAPLDPAFCFNIGMKIYL